MSHASQDQQMPRPTEADSQAWLARVHAGELALAAAVRRVRTSPPQRRKG